MGLKVSPHLIGSTLYEDLRIVIEGYEYNLKYVLATNTIFYLSNNKLNGEIPQRIGNISSIRLLKLSRNQLEGKIVTYLSEIYTLEELDLS